MNPEPLKGKEYDDMGDLFFWKKDVKSAVEWLRKWICIKNRMLNSECKPGYRCFNCKKLDKAFEDVVKK